MKILQFCKKNPIPPKDGESIAIHQLSKAFVGNECELTVFSLLTPKHNKTKNSVQIENVVYEYQKINTNISYIQLLKNMFFSKNSYITERFFNKGAKAKLIKLLQNNDFDIIQLEGIFLGDYIKYIRENSKAKIVLRAHNVEHQIWERLAENQEGLKKWYLNKIMIPRLRAFEEKVSNEVDLIVPISKLDEIFFKKISTKPCFTLPAAYEIIEEIKPLPGVFSVGFIGGLDWMPNSEGVKWFLKKVWRTFSNTENEVSFNLAGRNFPKRYYDLKDKKLYIFGEVGDAQEFTNQNSIMIAPILSGSGMRIKIIEAMALGRTVISTTIGAEGIDYTDKVNIFIANTDQEWIDTLTYLYQNQNILMDVGKAAQDLIRKEHDVNILGKNLINHYKTNLL